MISRYWASKKTFANKNQQNRSSSQRFKDVEEAEFKEIPTDKKDDD